MQGDTVRSGQTLSWQPRVRALTQSAARLRAVRDQVVRDLDLRSQEVDDLTARLDVLAKVGELFRALMDKLVLSHVKSIESVVTEGLHTIFFDQTLTFEAEIAQRYNRIAIDFFIRQQGADERIAIRGAPLDSFGGGPSSIASLVLRMLAMLRLKKWPVLFLDETLSPISDEYIESTGDFLRKLSTATGIPILLVTQKRGFVHHATTAYLASEVFESGARHLELEAIRGVS